MELYMIVIGGKPEGRNTEQHDVFFGIAKDLKSLVPALRKFWPALERRMHIDSWRKVTFVDGFNITVVPNTESIDSDVVKRKLYFVNLGGYKPDDMEEHHYKQLVVAENIAEAMSKAKETTFWKHHDSPHVDDKYGIDVDDIYEVEDLLDEDFKANFRLKISTSDSSSISDHLEIGYLKISKLLEC